MLTGDLAIAWLASRDKKVDPKEITWARGEVYQKKVWILRGHNSSAEQGAPGFALSWSFHRPLAMALRRKGKNWGRGRPLLSMPRPYRKESRKKGPISMGGRVVQRREGGTKG